MQRMLSAGRRGEERRGEERTGQDRTGQDRRAEESRGQERRLFGYMDKVEGTRGEGAGESTEEYEAWRRDYGSCRRFSATWRRVRSKSAGYEKSCSTT
jgi:hypothetical protein